MLYWRDSVYSVGNFPSPARVVYRTGVSSDDFWRAAKTGGRRIWRTPVTFGRQPTQVFGRPCRSTQSVIALRRNFWLEILTEEKECREWYETRPPGWEYSLSWTLSVQTCCLEPLLNTRAQACSEAFWRPRESHSMTSWCLDRSIHCPETRWREVEDSQQSRRVTTCTTGKACLTKTSTERTTESRRQSYKRPGREFAATRKKCRYPSDWQTALKRDCASLQPTVCEYFVTHL